MIGPGQTWDQAIRTRLEEAEIILILTSPDSLASEFIHEVEMKRAMERHQAGEARIIPVILRHCQWKRTPLGKLQALPARGRPLSDWPNADEALTGIADALAEVAEETSRGAGPK
jgi:hypothetical protein